MAQSTMGKQIPGSEKMQATITEKRARTEDSIISSPLTPTPQSPAPSPHQSMPCCANYSARVVASLLLFIS
ncbi:hypothetical protein J6590_002849 [Homalodisca vitripennis]|nr:hypothetical protein J6590_002849 [Homalodisca vitripennis]